MGGEYSVGDLVYLNEFGRLVIDNNQLRIGIIIGGPFRMVYSYFPSTPDDEFVFWCYDVIIGGDLITTVPEDFLQLFITEQGEFNEK